MATLMRLNRRFPLSVQRDLAQGPMATDIAAQLYAEATKKNIRGRSRVPKAALQRALAAAL